MDAVTSVIPREPALAVGADPLEQQLEDRGRARALFAARSPDQSRPPDLDARRRRRRPRTSARPASPRSPRRGRRSPSPTPRPSPRTGRRAPSAIARATWALTAPCAARTAPGTPSSVSFASFEYDDDPADEVAARPGDVGDRVGDQPARARLGERDRHAAAEAESLEPLGEPDERVRRPRYGCWSSSSGPPGGWNSHVSGMPRFPSAPSGWPFSVKNVAPDEPLRTSTESFAGERDDLALPERSRRPVRGVELAVDPDLDPGRAALDLDDEVHALVGDRDVAGERGRSCSPRRSR